MVVCVIMSWWGAGVGEREWGALFVENIKIKTMYNCLPPPPQKRKKKKLSGQIVPVLNEYNNVIIVNDLTIF